MKSIITTVILSIVMLSCFEILLPKGAIKNVALGVIGIIVVYIILSPILNLTKQVDSFYEKIQKDISGEIYE